MKGSIKLIYKGETIRQLNYATEWQKEDIASTWKRLYGKRFSNAKIELAPPTLSKKEKLKL